MINSSQFSLTTSNVQRKIQRNKISKPKNQIKKEKKPLKKNPEWTSSKEN